MVPACGGAGRGPARKVHPNAPTPSTPSIAARRGESALQATAMGLWHGWPAFDFDKV